MTDAITLLTDDHREVVRLLDQVLGGALDSDELVEAINTIIHDLSVHAVAEEVVLYPTVRDELPGGPALADEALEEHARVERALADLDGRDPREQPIRDQVQRVAEEVKHHVEEEEGDLFPALRKHLTAEQLEDLGTRLEKVKDIAPTRPHPNAPDTPPGNLLIGPPTGLVDRVRDALGG